MYIFQRVNLRVVNTLNIVYGEDKTIFDHAGLCEQIWRNMGKIYTEISVIEKIESDRINIHNEHYLLENSKAGQPTIFLFAHLGNWEIISRAIQKHDFMLNVVFELLPNRFHRILLSIAR